MTGLFANPELLWALALLPLVALLGWHGRRRRRETLVELGTLKVIPHGRPIWLGFGWALALGLLIVAAASPRWGIGPPPPTLPGCDAMLVVDLSRSMLANDALPSRLERAKSALGHLIDAVQQRGGHRLGIVAFAGRAQIVCPLTHDYDHVRSKLSGLTADPLPAALESMTTSGTRIGAGLATAVSALDPPNRGAQMIVLASDGDDPANDGEWREGYAAARRAGIPVFTVGVGDPNRGSRVAVGDTVLTFRGEPALTRLQEAPLREIAAKTGGAFITSGTAQPDLASLVRETMNRFPTREAIAGTLPQPVPRQLWFLFAALSVLLLLISGGYSRSIKRLAAPAGALLLVSASSVSDAELRRGIAALDAGQLESALTHFSVAGERTTDPGLVAFNEGVALYRLHRFREAELRFRCSLSDAEGARRANALYNLGCALVQSSQGRRAEPLRQAIASFEMALDCADLSEELRTKAQDNLALAKRLLAALPPESPQSTPEEGGPKPARPSSTRDPMTPDAADAGRRPGAETGERMRAGKADGTPRTTDRSPPPGKGSLPPLPDDATLVPLTPDDARAHLNRAAARIATARQAQLRTRGAVPSTQFPDW
jgi:Ca-activated chloride channel family protein